MSEREKSFIQITNRDIYDMIKRISEKLDLYREGSEKQYMELHERMAVLETKVKRQNWMLYSLWTAFVGIFMAAVFAK